MLTNYLNKFQRDIDVDEPQELPEETAKRLGVPLIPKREKRDVPSNPIVAICGECGYGVRQDMHHCNNSDCPVQTKITL